MERMPLSNKEYYALREVFGIVNSFAKCEETLKTRCKMIPGGWRDLRLICTKAEKLMSDLLHTVPLKKLQSMRAEFEHTVCEVRVTKDYTGKAKENGFSYVPDRELERLVERIINWECTCCDKSAKQGKRCPIFKDIEALYPWPITAKTDRCPFAGCSSVMED